MITIKQELQPIRTPNYILKESTTTARKQDGFDPRETNGIAVTDLSKETILELCEQFKQDLLKKAGY